MISESRMERYNRAYDRAATANPMTADCPPQDEADSIRDNFIEEVAEDTIRRAAGNPSFMMELLLETDYADADFEKMIKDLCIMMNDHSVDAKVSFAESMMTFIELKSAALAAEEIDS